MENTRLSTSGGFLCLCSAVPKVAPIYHSGLNTYQFRFGHSHINADWFANSSLGSFFFPSHRPEILRFVIESLIENGIPFLFAFASPFAPTLGTEIFDKIAKCEDAHAVKFAPQWAVCEHPATGYFFVRSCTCTYLPLELQRLLP